MILYFFKSFFVMSDENRMPCFYTMTCHIILFKNNWKKKFFYHTNSYSQDSQKSIYEMLIKKKKYIKNASHVYGLVRDGWIEIFLLYG